MLYVIARPSVRPSDTRVDQSKTVEGKITQPYHRVARDSSYLTHNFIAKFQREDRERGRRMTGVAYAIFSQ